MPSTLTQNENHNLLKSLDEVDFCVIDTETTGGNAENSRIIDVAVFRFQGGEIVEKFQSLVNPRHPIPPWITNLTSITDEMVENAPDFADIAEPLNAILSKGIFTAHNAGFDLGFVREEFRRVGKEFKQPTLCTLRLARILYPDLPSRSLGALCESMLIDIWDRHRASGDAEATVYVLKEIIRQVKKDFDIQTAEDLAALSVLGPLLLPKGMTLKTILGLPQAPGTFSMKDDQGNVVYSGKSKNVRGRVRNHFQSFNKSEKSMRLREKVASINVTLIDPKIYN